MGPKYKAIRLRYNAMGPHMRYKVMRSNLRLKIDTKGGWL